MPPGKARRTPKGLYQKEIAELRSAAERNAKVKPAQYDQFKADFAKLNMVEMAAKYKCAPTTISKYAKNLIKE